jgi:DNA-binding transcriptional MerR regulator
MPEKKTNYPLEAENDAKDMVVEFVDQIVEKLMEQGEASDDLNNDYSNGDSYHHETHVDKSYSLLEAAELLDQLSAHEETDSGLWEGQAPRDAISTQAAYTYGSAVYSEWTDLISTINENAKEVLEEFAEKKTELEVEIAELEAEENGEDWTGGKAQELRRLQGTLRAFDRRVKRAVEDSIYESIGRKRRNPQGEGPREWSPR